jgi:hypothetical protein
MRYSPPEAIVHFASQGSTGTNNANPTAPHPVITKTSLRINFSIESKFFIRAIVFLSTFWVVFN